MQPQLTNLLAMVPKEKRPQFVRLLLKNTATTILGWKADKSMLQTIAETVWVCLEEAEPAQPEYFNLQ